MLYRMYQFYYRIRIFLRVYARSLLFFTLILFIIIGSFLYAQTHDPQCAFSFISDIASGVTIISLFFVYETLRQSKSLHEAEVMDRYNSKYESSEMYEDLRILSDLDKVMNLSSYRTHKDNPNSIPEGIKKEVWLRMDKVTNSSEPWSKEEHLNHRQDVARRRVKFYFLSALDLYENGRLSLYVFRNILRKSGISLLFSVVESMEYSINPNYDYGKFYHLMLLMSGVVNGEKKTNEHFRNANCSQKEDILESNEIKEERRTDCSSRAEYIEETQTKNIVEKYSILGIPFVKKEYSCSVHTKKDV